MALSILSYNLPHGLKMLSSNANSSNNNNSNNISVSSPPTGDENSSNSSGGGRTTITIGKSPFSRITMQNVLSESSSNVLNISNNSNVNTIVRKIKDIGMYGSVNNAGGLGIGRKRPLNQSSATVQVKTAEEVKPTKNDNNDKLEKTKLSGKQPKTVSRAENASEKTPKAAVEKKTTSVPKTANRQPTKPKTPGVKKTGGTPGRKGLPLPQAVARRNARERNRVKQVNNGFAALRERIPEEVAEAFEAQGNGRGTVKKLSKVETLRMAVEYIRSLERLLGFDFPIGSDRGLALLQASSSSDDSFTFIKDEFDALSPPLDDSARYEDSLSTYDVDDYLNSTDLDNQSISETQSSMQTTNTTTTTDASAYEMDLLPSLTTINGLQYIRIPGTNTYQLLTPDMLFMTNAPHSPPTSSLDEECFQALIDSNCSPSPVTATSSPHISPASQQSINATAAPAMQATNNLHVQQQQQQQQHDAAMSVNEEIVIDECVNVAAVVDVLSRRTPVDSSSPTAHSSLHHRQLELRAQSQTPTQGSTNLSPADNNTFLLRTCATTSATAITTTTTTKQLMAAKTSPANAADEIDGYAERNGGNNRARQQQQQQQSPFMTLATPIALSMQPSRAIKQEYNDTLTCYAPANVTPSPPPPPPSSSPQTTPKHFITGAGSALAYQQQQLQFNERLLLSHAAPLSSMSPPLERCSSRATPTAPTILYMPNNNNDSSATTASTPTPITPTSAPSTPGLTTFYESEQESSFFEGSHIIFKKEYNEAILQAAAAQAAEEDSALNELADENIIEVMDWWEAHTPKSADGSVALL